MGERRSTVRSDGGAESRGATNISDAVVSKIAGVAAQEVEKVQMGGGATAAVTGFLGSVSGAVKGSSSGGSPTRAVSRCRSASKRRLLT